MMVRPCWGSAPGVFGPLGVLGILASLGCSSSTGAPGRALDAAGTADASLAEGVRELVEQGAEAGTARDQAGGIQGDLATPVDLDPDLGLDLDLAPDRTAPDSSDATAPSDARQEMAQAAGNDARDVQASETGGGDRSGLDARDAGSGAPAGDGAVAIQPWPGANAVATVDDTNVFGMDLSGLFYQPATAAAPAVLWGVDNGDSKLYQLSWDGTRFVPVAGDSWSAGKLLRFPTGNGNPDCEGITKAELDSPAVYISSEHNTAAGGTSRLSVLRYDTSGSSAATLTATHEWNLTSDIPPVDANKGIEAITWIPDGDLLAKGFLDESTGVAYDPAAYPNHGTGLFFVGMEGTGRIYGYALEHTASTFHRIAEIVSGQAGVMDLSFDRDVGTLWSYCDEVCDNRATLLDIDVGAGSPTRGRYRVRAIFSRPGTLPNAGNEGIAIAPETECAADRKPFYWSDDSNTASHAIRRDLIPCGRLY